MNNKKDIKEIVSVLVDKFDLESNSKSGIISGEELKDKLSSFLYSITKESLEERREKFTKELGGYVEEYGANLCNKFYSYWTKCGENDRKMPFEKEKSFDMKLRLETFRRNEIKFNAINLIK